MNVYKLKSFKKCVTTFPVIVLMGACPPLFCVFEHVHFCLFCPFLSLIQFFSKMRKWADMSKLSQDFRLRMERLERNFEVSTVIFRKFEPIFMDMFQNPQGTDPPRQPRSRKHRLHTQSCLSNSWLTFLSSSVSKVLRFKFEGVCFKSL